MFATGHRGAHYGQAEACRGGDLPGKQAGRSNNELVTVDTAPTEDPDVRTLVLTAVVPQLGKVSVIRRVESLDRTFIPPGKEKRNLPAIRIAHHKRQGRQSRSVLKCILTL